MDIGDICSCPTYVYMSLLFQFLLPESGEEDNTSQSTLSSSVTLHPSGSTDGETTQPSLTPTKNSASSATPSTPSKAAASLEEGGEKQSQGEKSGDPVVKTETSVKRPRGSPSREDSDGVISSPSPPPPSTTISKRSSDKRSLKHRRYIKKKEREEGEDSDESEDSESDSDDPNEARSHSHSRSDTMRYPRRERRRRSPGNAPPRGGGDQQSKIPTVCRHFLNGKYR